MSFSPYAEESLRVLHENAVLRFREFMESADAISLSRAIGRLAVAQQSVLTLRYFEGLATADIANVLRISAGEVVHSHALAILAIYEVLLYDRADQQL